MYLYDLSLKPYTFKSVADNKIDQKVYIFCVVIYWLDKTNNTLNKRQNCLIKKLFS
jgi:hypothetical protein